MLTLSFPYSLPVMYIEQFFLKFSFTSPHLSVMFPVRDMTDSLLGSKAFLFPRLHPA